MAATAASTLAESFRDDLRGSGGREIGCACCMCSSEIAAEHEEAAAAVEVGRGGQTDSAVRVQFSQTVYIFFCLSADSCWLLGPWPGKSFRFYAMQML